MNLGFSLYFGSGVEKNCALIKRFSQAGFTKAFTSLHIPEESHTNYVHDIQILFEACKKYNSHGSACFASTKTPLVAVEKQWQQSIDATRQIPVF